MLNSICTGTYCNPYCRNVGYNASYDYDPFDVGRIDCKKENDNSNTGAIVAGIGAVCAGAYLVKKGKIKPILTKINELYHKGASAVKDFFTNGKGKEVSKKIQSYVSKVSNNETVKEAKNLCENVVNKAKIKGKELAARIKK